MTMQIYLLYKLDKTAVVVAEDIDILVLLNGLTPPNKKIYLIKPEKKQKVATVYSSDSFNKFPFCKKYILLLHMPQPDVTLHPVFMEKAKRMLLELLRRNVMMKNSQRR